MRLAASAEMLFLDLPFAERVTAIAALGFEVEIWNWQTKDLGELVRTGATFSLTAARTLERLARLGERAGRVFTLENLNTAVDHPGTPFARAADTLALVEAVGSPHLRLNLDLYHAQIGEGNLVELVERALPHVGEIQVADVPGRGEPGTGEIHYPAVAAALRKHGYDGVVALEAWASGESPLALSRFRGAFESMD
ncbi:TIM barrel protein [Actinoplanes sp. NPDC026619]|uniref:TIM barrel protein n=1 Tax=Actinoplanes sp. NPDC026619 TaxID=3155798 RepID=UPI0033CD7A27